MSDGNPPDDMFGGLPFMADLMKLLQGQTSGSNDTARQLAHTIANDGLCVRVGQRRADHLVGRWGRSRPDW